MVEMQVIEKCDDSKASDWVNSLAFSRKANGELHICLDLKHLSEQISHTHHKIPTVEELGHRFSGATIFSKLDVKHGYWGIKLDKASSDLCTFNSLNGKYKFTRLSFELSVSQDIFQKYMDDVI